MTALVLLMFIASWAIVIGVLQIWGAIRLRKEIEGEWLLGLSGVLSVAFGVIMFAQPGAGALALVWLIGWFAHPRGLRVHRARVSAEEAQAFGLSRGFGGE